MLSRRRFLAGIGAGGIVLAAQPFRALAAPLGTITGPGADRASRLHAGLRLAHADLHNHSHLSDGAGDPKDAFPSMRVHGLDVASLTDHSTLSFGAFSLLDICGEPLFPEAESGSSHDCRQLLGITEAAWETTARLADELHRDGEFVAIRGFEWSSPILGHMNVWFSQRWIDPLHTGGVGPEGVGAEAHAFPELGPELLQPLLDEITRQSPLRGTGMAPFFQWLRSAPDAPVFGGGNDGIASFNHPGREPGRFGYFRYFPENRQQIVALEIMNRNDDYLFEGYGDGQYSPLVECLNAGWRVGLTGVTDEHGTNWGTYQGKGRTGLWLREDLGLTRGGVREAMQARRVFATREAGLRLDATANGVQMGMQVPHGSGPVNFAVDLDLGPAGEGKRVEIQVLRPDAAFPRVVYTEHAVVGVGAPIRFATALDRADGDWVVLRVADPSKPNDQQGPDGHAANNRALAYASPFWLVESSAASDSRPDEAGSRPEGDGGGGGDGTDDSTVVLGAVGQKPSSPGPSGNLPITGGAIGFWGLALAAIAAGARRLLRSTDADRLTAPEED
ncbi:MAG: hypothetical protein WD646_04225 [Actinomycetota bacterium]